MCGIAGWIGHMPDPKRAFDILANPLMSRGMDAGGVGVFSKAAQNIWKQPGPIMNVFDQNGPDIFSRAVNADVVFIHTRLATHGSPNNNVNNHPIWGNRYILIHNGIVQTDKIRPARGQTDSEQMLQAIEEKGLPEGLWEARGTKSIALYDKYSNKCYLFRNFYPLYYVVKENNLYFSSQALPLWLLTQKNPKSIKPNLLYKINIS